MFNRINTKHCTGNSDAMFSISVSYFDILIIHPNKTPCAGHVTSDVPVGMVGNFPSCVGVYRW